MKKLLFVISVLACMQDTIIKTISAGEMSREELRALFDRWFDADRRRAGHHVVLVTLYNQSPVHRRIFDALLDLYPEVLPENRARAQVVSAFSRLEGEREWATDLLARIRQALINDEVAFLDELSRQLQEARLNEEIMEIE